MTDTERIAELEAENAELQTILDARWAGRHEGDQALARCSSRKRVDMAGPRRPVCLAVGAAQRFNGS